MTYTTSSRERVIKKNGSSREDPCAHWIVDQTAVQRPHLCRGQHRQEVPTLYSLTIVDTRIFNSMSYACRLTEMHQHASTMTFSIARPRYCPKFISFLRCSTAPSFHNNNTLKNKADATTAVDALQHHGRRLRSRGVAGVRHSLGRRVPSLAPVPSPRDPPPGRRRGGR